MFLFCDLFYTLQGSHETSYLAICRSGTVLCTKDGVDVFCWMPGAQSGHAMHLFQNVVVSGRNELPDFLIQDQEIKTMQMTISRFMKSMNRCCTERIQTGRGQNTQLDHIISLRNVESACDFIFIGFIICFHYLHFFFFWFSTNQYEKQIFNFHQCLECSLYLHLYF